MIIFKIIDKLRNSYKIFRLFTDRILNNGERFDPKLFKEFNLKDNNSLERYNFVKNLLNKSDKVLDIACGTGYGSLMMADFCNQVIGIDCHQKSIKFANRNYKKRDNIEYIKNDFRKNQLTADAVISLETIEHLDQQLEESMSQLLSWTKRILIVSTPYREAAGHNQHHKHFYIDENCFKKFKNQGKITFFYQSENGSINTYSDPSTESLLTVINVYDCK